MSRREGKSEPRRRKFQSLHPDRLQELSDLEYNLPTIQIYILSEYHNSARAREMYCMYVAGRVVSYSCRLQITVYYKYNW